MFGAKYLSEILRTHNVRSELIRLLYYVSCFCFKQSITTLLLRCDQIGDDGTRHIANVLKTNEVNYTHLLCSLKILCLFVNRNWSRWILVRMKSVLKDVTILLMHFEKIRLVLTGVPYLFQPFSTNRRLQHWFSHIIKLMLMEFIFLQLY